ncbi:Phosphomannomutase/phosphoglucomutase [Candidatus Desulfarcum epimagneticum]|uniref:Phosphomannomutase/phosphoglucomutase n=1 Tax=uncultured Desulfobacteraceae bacterium TaxID=218296 RepID=A0A484HEH9_9BACT|nr:Phosphomannomutase/phosphoglucomutase [uncultured Desulfobacteraceae bacterium]
MNPEIFKEYDIRGVAGKDFDENDLFLIGRALGTFLKQRGRTRLSVGRDCRVTSDLYRDRLVEGLVATGCHVVDVGVCPTPVFYFSIRSLGLEGGAMVTASHNPKEFNGLKLCSGLDSIHGADILKIADLIQSREFAEGKGSLEQKDVMPAYRAFMKENIRLSRPLKVGVDAGNGVAGPVVAPLLREMGCEVHDLFCDMDGTFPNHEADPTVEENMRALSRLVREKNLDLGVGYDGDGDRLGVVDEKGRMIAGDRLMIVFIRDILKKSPGATFISEVKCSRVLYDEIEALGGRGIMWKTGHSLIKGKMKEEKAVFAGELSGHLFFGDRYFGYDDAIYAALRLLEILSATGQSVSGLLSDVPETVNTPEIRIERPDSEKFEIVRAAGEYFKKSHEVIDIDGARIMFEGGWALVRASNTQPALSLRFEADTPGRLDEIRAIVEGKLKEISEKIIPGSAF